MTTTSMGTRVMAAISSSEFEAAAATCRPRSLRSASAKSWVWVRVPSATTILTKSEPNFSWDGIGSPDVWSHESDGGNHSVRLNGQRPDKGLWGRKKMRQKNRPGSLATLENIALNSQTGK